MSIRTMDGSSEPSFGEFVSIKALQLARLVQVLVHAVIGLHLGDLLLHVVRAMRVDLDFRLPVLRLGEVVFEFDADELPLVGLLGDLGGSEGLHLFAGGVFEVVFVAFGLDDGGGSGLVLELELEIELLFLLRAVVGVVAGDGLLLFMVVLEIDYVHLLQLLELLVIAAVTADAPAMGLLIPARENIGPQFGLLVSDVDGLANLPLLLGEDDGGRFDGEFGLAGLLGGTGLGGIGLVGVVARPFVLLLGLRLEEVECLVHRSRTFII